MGNSTSITRPEELIKFRKLNTSIDNVDLPARPENRTVTDKKGFLIFGLLIILLLPLVIYVLTKSDLRHYETGYDDCGNFCGYENKKIDGIYCSGKDYRTKPVSNNATCVSQCPENIYEFAGQCLLRRGSYNFVIPESEDEEPIDEGAVAWRFIVSILVTISLSILMLTLLRCVPAVVIWTLLVLSIIVLIGVSALLWFSVSTTSHLSDRNFNEEPLTYETVNKQKMTHTTLIIIATIWTIVALVIIVIIGVLFKKIKLIVGLYREATKVFAALPMLIIVPIIMTVIQCVVITLFALTTFYMLSALELVKVRENKYVYQIGGLTAFVVTFNILMLLYVVRLIAGIHFMIVSGSVSSWFFTRNKEYLGTPILTSFANTMKFHLGTVAFGSFLMFLFGFAKAILKPLCRNACCRCVCMMCCSQLDIAFNFLSENSYIETGIHGQSYLRSAKRATKLLFKNAKSVIAINCIGDFILGMIIFLLTVITTGISYALFLNAGIIAIYIPLCLIINVIIISTIFSVFQTIIDTLFICFCEDSVINDGMSRPYYMSRGLMEFIENSKKMYHEKS